MKFNSIILWAIASATATIEDGTSYPSKLVSEYRAALMPSSPRDVVYGWTKYVSDPEVTAAIVVAGAHLIATHMETLGSEPLLATRFYPRVHLMMILNRQGNARDHSSLMNRSQAALHARLAKQISDMMTMPDAELGDVARAVTSFRRVATNARKFGIDFEEDIESLLRNMEDLIEILVIEGKYCLAKRSPHTVLAVLSVIETLMAEPPVRSEAATGWTSTLVLVNSLVTYVRSMADSVDARGDDDHKLMLDILDMLSALRIREAMARPVRG